VELPYDCILRLDTKKIKLSIDLKMRIIKSTSLIKKWLKI